MSRELGKKVCANTMYFISFDNNAYFFQYLQKDSCWINLPISKIFPNLSSSTSEVAATSAGIPSTAPKPSRDKVAATEITPE